MTVLVTGARGFIGAATTVALREAGFHVKAGVRGSPEAAGAIPCDLDAPASLPEALRGVETVVHAAYGDIAAMPRQMQALLDAMSVAGAKNLILLSSIAVYGEAEGLVDEATPPRGLDPYGAAKVACEAAIRVWAQGERRAVLLRPGIVYGAGSLFWIDKLAQRLRAGAWGEMGARGEGVAALIHVDDLTAMIAGLATRLEAPARTDLDRCLALNAVGPATPSWNAYFVALAEALNTPLPRWGASQICRRRALALLAKVWRRLGLPGGGALALGPTGGELALFARRASYATGAARRLGLVPTIGLADGLSRSRLV